MELEFLRQIFEKYTNIKVHEIPHNGNRVVPCWQTGMTKLIVAFSNVANMPKNYILLFSWKQIFFLFLEFIG